MGKRIVIALLVVALLVSGGWWWHSRKGSEDPAQKAKGPQLVETAAVEPRDITTVINTVGSLIAGESAAIHAEIAGQVQTVAFEEGQPVKKGDVLIKMDSSLIETDLAKAKSALEVAAATFQRDDKLKAGGFVAGQQWDVSRADYRAAQAAVENAQILLTKTEIKAPFDGVAGLRKFSPGDYATAGQDLTTVVSLNPLKLEFSAPEKDYASVRQGQKIIFAVDAFPQQEFEGEIYAIDPTINPENRNFTVKATVPNDEGKLRPGMYARIRIETQTREGVPMMPEQAVIPEGTDAYAFVMRNGKAHRVKLSLGERQQGAVEVREGLKAGDRVITAGVMKLREGSPVTEETPQAATSAPEGGHRPASGPSGPDERPVKAEK
ncbi:MAG TPA: efflux RND transporter periplasmic adaptor subunit [Patescibacteria group bacterium]|nr:efflux RND transporter periplasmic adaptor subunit [Patescibacteria group bacterium]